MARKFLTRLKRPMKETNSLVKTFDHVTPPTGIDLNPIMSDNILKLVIGGSDFLILSGKFSQIVDSL